ncbi:hypothetical protein Scep_014157 [Stephania cephalantha]|uniref:Uncharacterized protein n=1 Tax=Stephania cephalantha TaxID=152367 RepID=A0AAP0J399_9MAGN
MLSVVKDEDQGLTSEIFDEAGSPRSSVKVVNVDDFGAKGDGTDDSEISGTIEASNDRSDYEEDAFLWLMFKGIEDFVIEGGGTIDGKGEIWWEHSCKINKSRGQISAILRLPIDYCRRVVLKQGQYLDPLGGWRGTNNAPSRAPT